MKSPLIDPIDTHAQQMESEAILYIPEVSTPHLVGDRNSRSVKNKEVMLGKLLSKGFNFGIYRLRRLHYVLDETA